MALYPLTVPFSVELTRESGWEVLPGQHSVYFALRFHLLLDEHPAEHTTYPGEILKSYRPIKGILTEATHTIECEFTSLNLEETIRSHLITREELQETLAEFSGSLGVNDFALSGKAQAGITNRLLTSVEDSSKHQLVETRRRMERFELKQTIQSGSNHLIHAVNCYKPMAVDVYCHYYDYLFAVYSASLWGLRKKKINLPRPDADRHNNRVKLNRYLFTLRYWQMLPQSSLLYTDSEYQRAPKVNDPLAVEVKIDPPIKPLQQELPRQPERPTLYTLSNIAFPFRWIERKGPWTMEDLMKVELDEAEGSYWWFLYGPGRDHHPRNQRQR